MTITFTLIGVTILVLILMLIFLPLVIAHSRGSTSKTAIGLLTIFIVVVSNCAALLGFTILYGVGIIGWIVLTIWAMASDTKAKRRERMLTSEDRALMREFVRHQKAAR